MYRNSPAQLSKTEARDRIRLIASADQFKDIIVERLILLPEKPPSKARNRRKKPSTLLLMDALFLPFDGLAPPPPDGMMIDPGPSNQQGSNHGGSSQDQDSDP